MEQEREYQYSLVCMKSYLQSHMTWHGSNIQRVSPYGDLKVFLCFDLCFLSVQPRREMVSFFIGKSHITLCWDAHESWRIWWNVGNSKRTTKCQESLLANCSSSFSQEDYQFCMNGGYSKVQVITMTSKGSFSPSIHSQTINAQILAK